MPTFEVDDPFWPHLRKMLRAEAYIDTSKVLANNFGGTKAGWMPPSTRVGAVRLLRSWIQAVLLAGHYKVAGQVLWGDDNLWVDQRFSMQIWEKVPKYGEIMILGAGSVGKTYGLAAWNVLDFIVDPLWTSVKVVSVTQKHAEANAFANMSKFLSSSAIPLGMNLTASMLTANPTDKRHGISLIAIPKGDKGVGRLQGMHTVPRPMHPKFGTQSRIRVLMDEAEEIPEGVWKDIDNVLTGKEGTDRIKVMASANPRRREGQFLRRAEPVKGWRDLDLEEDEFWISKQNWAVLRFDGAKCENVVEKKLLYAGLQTWDGYKRYLMMDGSPEYFTMARGAPPPQGSIPTVCSPVILDQARGSYIFVGATTYVSATDLAFTGVDAVVTAIGKYGMANGYKNWDGTVVKFEKQRMVLEVVDVFEMEKKPTEEISADIISNARLMNIDADKLALDRTGNGQGTYDVTKSAYGNILGISFGEKPSKKRILEDDKMSPQDRFHKVNSEMAFAVSYWAEAGFLKFAAKTDVDKWDYEITDRRYVVRSNKIEVESKDNYKARTGRGSPDRADSVGMLLHLVRMRESIRAYILEKNMRTGVEKGYTSEIDQLEGLE